MLDHRPAGFCPSRPRAILQKTLRGTQLWKGTPADMVETGGGAGSNTVISPALFREFCLPYDQQQHAAMHEAGVKIVYHLCGGVMQMLDLVTHNGADGLETMTPPAMGGDCDLREASRRVGDKLFFIGGFDQNAGFENGTPESAPAAGLRLLRGHQGPCRLYRCAVRPLLPRRPGQSPRLRRCRQGMRVLESFQFSVFRR